MLDSVATTLRNELKEEFQIPPYFPDESLERYVKEGDAFFTNLVKEIDYDTDLQARSLLKNYVFYAYHKKLDEFVINYNSNIVTWQMSLVGRGEGNE